MDRLHNLYLLFPYNILYYNEGTIYLDASKKYELRENPSEGKYYTNWLTDAVLLEYIDSTKFYQNFLF